MADRDTENRAEELTDAELEAVVAGKELLTGGQQGNDRGGRGGRGRGHHGHHRPSHHGHHRGWPA